MGRPAGFAALLVVMAFAIPLNANAAGQEFWDTYGFLELYGGRQVGVTGDSTDGWKEGVRLRRVGWLTGWEADLSVGRGEHAAGDPFQVSLDGFLKPAESAHASLLVLVGLGVTSLRDGSEPDDSVFFHYRYGLAYRFRFSERIGLRTDLTGLRSRAQDFSSREATLGWVVYF